MNDMLATQDVTPEVRAAGRSGLDHILAESVLELAREVDALTARVGELEAER